jgi:hypothetical protein
MPDDFARALAAYLRTPVATLRYWRYLGTGSSGFRMERRVMFRREDLDRWLTDQIGAEAFRR